MRTRAMYIGGAVVLCVLMGTVVLSSIGPGQCAEWVVSGAVGFFTHQEVSPGHEGLVETDVAHAAVLPLEDTEGGDKAVEEGERPLRLAEVKDKKTAAENGLALMSGQTEALLTSEDSDLPEHVVEAPEAEQVRETEARMVSTLTQLVTPDRPEAENSPGTEKPAGTVGRRERSEVGWAVAERAVQVAGDKVNPAFCYRGHGRRDPFRALVREGEDGEERTDRLDPAHAKLVGILWGGKTNLALLEDLEGYSYCLKVGDRVKNGRLAAIRSNSVVFGCSRYGQPESIVVELDEKKAGSS